MDWDNYKEWRLKRTEESFWSLTENPNDYSHSAGKNFRLKRQKTWVFLRPSSVSEIFSSWFRKSGTHSQKNPSSARRDSEQPILKSTETRARKKREHRGTDGSRTDPSPCGGMHRALQLTPRSGRPPNERIKEVRTLAVLFRLPQTPPVKKQRRINPSRAMTNPIFSRIGAKTNSDKLTLPVSIVWSAWYDPVSMSASVGSKTSPNNGTFRNLWSRFPEYEDQTRTGRDDLSEVIPSRVYVRVSAWIWIFEIGFGWQWA